MKKKRFVLGKGYPRRYSNNAVTLSGYNNAWIDLKYPREVFTCYCKENCKCKKAKLILEVE